MDNINFKLGKIVYNEFNIDFNVSFFEQLDCLTEDLLQVKYPGGYLLDLGWYPEYNENGRFIVQLIKENNWDCPRYKKSCKDEKKLKKYINEIIMMLDDDNILT